MTNTSDVSTIADFCRRFRIDRATYYRNAKLGTMPPAIKVGGALRILAADEEAWVAQQRQDATKSRLAMDQV